MADRFALPRSLDEAAAFLGALTPEDWADFRLGLGTLLLAVAIAGILVWAVRTASRRG
jgi:hypothetical protein